MSKHNLVCWNARILGSVKYGQGKKALENAERREGVHPTPVYLLREFLNVCA
jgi:hypothetical protein